MGECFRKKKFKYFEVSKVYTIEKLNFLAWYRDKRTDETQQDMLFSNDGVGLSLAKSN
jgi:hypothetical protein